jgi:hypothetical protein
MTLSRLDGEGNVSGHGVTPDKAAYAALVNGAGWRALWPSLCWRGSNKACARKPRAAVSKVVSICTPAKGVSALLRL